MMLIVLLMATFTLLPYLTGAGVPRVTHVCYKTC
jgi:hypothetical protein